MKTCALIAEAEPWGQEEQPGANYNLLIMIALILGVLLLLGWRRRSRIRRRLEERKESINLKCPFCDEVMSAPVMPPPILHDGVKVGQRATCPSCGKVSLIGIRRFGGWLFLFAMALVFSMTSLLFGVSDDGTIGPGPLSAAIRHVADQGPAGLLNPRTLLQIGLSVFLMYVAFVFFTKKAHAPAMVIALLLANGAMALVVLLAMDRSGGGVGNAFGVAAVWVPYFLFSRRVKATFGRRGVARPIPEKELKVSQGSGSATTPPKIETQADEGDTQ
ncbi:MAG: DUF2569 family protein [Phycisphaerae bacterium]